MAQEKYKVISWEDFHRLYPSVAKDRDYEVDIMNFNRSFLWYLPDGTYFMQANDYLHDHLLIFDKEILFEIKKNELVPFTREADLFSIKYRDKVLSMEDNYMFFIDLLQKKLDIILSLEYSEENIRLLHKKIIEKKLYEDPNTRFLAVVYINVLIKKECKNMIWTTQRGVIGLNYYLYPDLTSVKYGRSFASYPLGKYIYPKKKFDDGESNLVRRVGRIISDYNEAEKNK